MIGEKIIRQAAIRKGQRGSLFELYAWFFMRISGAILMVIAVYHLIYMHFIVPGGVANIDQAMVVARWTDPAWGLFWRTFDLLLLVFASTHGANGLRRIIQDYIHNPGWRIASTTLLSLVWFTLMVMGAIIIFSFKVVR